MFNVGDIGFDIAKNKKIKIIESVELWGLKF